MVRGLALDGPAFLASVTDCDEARIALAAGASIIDCKDPTLGALGALDSDRIRTIVHMVVGRAPVSATIGDLPNDAVMITAAAAATARTGVDLVKVGFFGAGEELATIRALGQTDLGRARLVAVLMADRAPDFSLLPDLAAAGFVAVMLDTADKRAGSLPDVLAPRRLAEFVAAAHADGLLAGLAGSLRLDHINEIDACRPDIIGFRGALCSKDRTAALDAARCNAVGYAMSAAAKVRRAALAAT